MSLSGGHTIADFTAVGVTTGTTYTLVDSRQITGNFRTAGTAEDGYTSVGTWTTMFVSRGDGPNLVMKQQSKVTITSDGELVVVFDKHTIHCVG